jgi:hypothetical protein
MFGARTSAHSTSAEQRPVDEIVERYALNLSQGGMFIREDAPPAVGQMVLVEFVLPDGGIDLGTVNSCIAIVEDGNPRVIKNKRGYEIIPFLAAASVEASLLDSK